MQDIRIPIFCAILLCLANSTARAADKTDKTASGSMKAASAAEAGAARSGAAGTAAAKPKYHIDFKPANSPDKNKPFQTLQASLPDNAVKVYLHRIKAEPNTFAGLLSSSGIESTTGTSQVPSLSSAGTAFDTGNSPRIMTTAGTAIPQTMGSSFSFFK
jgi:hypothetical protein